MALPADVLARLASLSGYDQILEMDTISRTRNVGLAVIESELAAYEQGVHTVQQGSHGDDFVPGAHKDVVDLDQAQPMQTGPKYIEDPDQYRLKNDPSQQGQANQSQVSQAIICPACSAPLGIPDVRPIKVTCPQCMHESVFNS